MNYTSKSGMTLLKKALPFRDMFKALLAIMTLTCMTIRVMLEAVSLGNLKPSQFQRSLMNVLLHNKSTEIVRLYYLLCNLALLRILLKNHLAAKSLCS